MSTIAAVLGRILIGILFIVSGAWKLTHITGTEQTIAGVGLPAGLGIPTGVFEVAAGVCLALGIMTRLVALLLAGFTLLTIAFFHSTFASFEDWISVLQHLALIGGLLLVFAHSQMWWSWDRMRRTRKGEVMTRSAEQRAHDAELRAARAEGGLHALQPDVQPVHQPAAKRRWFS